MPIITKAGSPVKGSPTQFTLDKAELAAVTSVAADSYFSDSSNWKEVALSYRSSTSNQSEIVKFDASLASPTANFTVSLKARDIFQIHKIVIKDFDGGTFEVPRSQLDETEFDVDVSVQNQYLRNYITLNSLQVDELFTGVGGSFDANGMNLSASMAGVGNSLYYSKDLTQESFFINGGIGDYKLTLDFEVIVPYYPESTDFRISVGTGFLALGAANPLINSTGVKQLVHTFTGINPLGNAGYGSGLFILMINSCFGQHLAFSSAKFEKL